jgi:thiol:disulfide interchange protein DsbC
MKSSRGLLLALLLPLCACAKAAAPAAPAAPKMDASDPRVALSARIPDTKPEDLRATPVPGIYELTHGADITYVSADGKFVFAGDMYSVSDKGDFPNLTESRRRELRLKLIGQIPESQMIVFGPAKAKHTITVFTDIDCPWCQRLHAQMAEYNKQGVRVRYLLYPRTGPDTESWAKAETVWCSADRNDAFTRAKRGEKMKTKACPGAPVARSYALGREIGISGTPGMVMDTGELIPGYLSPEQLEEHLKQPQVAANH